MNGNLVKFLRNAAPFLITLVLWRLSDSFWNPGGVLAMIPIFYCSFVLRVPWFAPYAAIFCFLIDYKFNTTFYWTAMYCMFFAANGFQEFIDLARLDKNAIDAFMAFFGLCVLILAVAHISLAVAGRAAWTFAWAATLYIPMTTLISGVYNHD